MRKTWRGASFLLASVMVMAPTSAWAQQPAAPQTEAQCAQEAKVKELKDKGNEAMEGGRPPEALAAYEEAFSICKQPALLYNLGRVHLAREDYPKALQYLEQFDREAPPELKARVPGLQKLIDEQRARVGSVVITVNVPGAKVRIREKSVGETPFAGALHINAGKAVVEVVAEGYFTFTKEVDVPAGKETVLDVKLSSRNQFGMLVVKSPVKDALVFVDGRPIGKAPVEHEVSIGKHRVLVRREGYREADQQVTLAQGEKKELSLTPEYITPLTQKWWFWTTIGAVVAAGTVTTIVVLNTEKDPDRGTLPPGVVVAGASHGIRF